MMVKAQFKIDLPNPPNLEDDLIKLFKLRQHLRQLSPNLAEWFLGGNTKNAALLYPAFDESGPTDALTAVLQEKYRNKKSNIISRPLGLWNGEEGVEHLVIHKSAPPPSRRKNTLIFKDLTRPL
ncbi:MAG: hypothetical protein V4754_04310 [Pseudomonadota bacterium]